MKQIIIAALAICLTIPAFARGGGRSGGHRSSGSHHSSSGHHSSKAPSGTGAKSQREHVRSYTKKDGTHVAGHNRSTADETKRNNWSTKGNRNPDTGKPGSK